MIHRIGQAYRRRRAVMEKAIVEFGLTVASNRNSGGSSFWMQVPGGVIASELATKLRNAGVLVEEGRVFFAPDDNNERYYRLAYSSIPSARIREGIKRISDAIARLK